MIIRCFKTRLRAGFQQCWRNKPGSNPHFHGQADLFGQDWRERYLRRKSKKLPLQRGARQRQVSKTQAQGTVPIPVPFGALPSLDYGCSAQTLEFSSSTSNKTEQSSRILLHRHKHEASFLRGRRDIYSSCCTHGSPILFIPEMRQSQTLPSTSLFDTDNRFAKLTLFVFSFIIRDF